MVVFQPATVALLIVGATVFGTFIEKRFGIFSRLTILWHVFVNSEVKFRVEADYSGDLPFDHATEEAKNVFRERYEDVEVEHDRKDDLEMMVGDEFRITFEKEGDGIRAYTGKIVSTRRALKHDLNTLFTALGSFEKRGRAQTKEPDAPFEEQHVSVDLHLPHKNKYIDFHLPLGAWVTEHEFTIRHTKFNWTIAQEGDRTIIDADTRREAKRLVHAAIGPFLTF